MDIVERLIENADLDAAEHVPDEIVELQRAAVREIQRLRGLSAHLAHGLVRVKTQPANESAFIAAVFLDDAKKTYGLEVV